MTNAAKQASIFFRTTRVFVFVEVAELQNHGQPVSRDLAGRLLIYVETDSAGMGFEMKPACQFVRVRQPG